MMYKIYDYIPTYNTTNAVEIAEIGRLHEELYGFHKHAV